MKRFVLCVCVLFFGLVKPKAQPSPAIRANLNTNCIWKTGKLFSDHQPVELIRFHGKMKKDRITLEWTIVHNEQVNLFEVEKSANGINFETTGLVFSSEKEGTEQYAFFEKANARKKIFYRLKLIDKAQGVDYSIVLSFHPGNKNVGS